MGFAEMVVGERNHAPHAVVDVVAVEANEQDNDSGNSRPEDFKGKISLDGNAITNLTNATSESDQAEHQQSNNPDKENGSDCE
jgi:hypothetical protein